jgi:hypothetical protein
MIGMADNSNVFVHVLEMVLRMLGVHGHRRRYFLVHDDENLDSLVCFLEEESIQSVLYRRRWSVHVHFTLSG